MPTEHPPSPPPLQIVHIERALQTSSIGQRIVYAPRLTSTMPLAHQLVRQAPSPRRCAGLVVTTEEQTAGRGRLARRWETPAGRALLTSVVIAPPLLPSLPAQLPMISALAALEAARAVVPALAPHLYLKWPNDLLVVAAGRMGKLAGLLIESAFATAEPDRPQLAYAVVGIGFNVNQRAAELPPPRPRGIPPTSLYVELGHEVSREDLLITLCRTLDALLAPSSRPSPQVVHQRWQAALVNLGQQVTVYRHEGDQVPIHGRATGTTPTGGLIVEGEDGARQIVEAGDAEFQWDLP